jgi:hypothetical protein
MTTIIASIAKWIWSKAITLLIIVVILLAVAWIRMELGTLRERLTEAEATEQIANRISNELDLLEQRRKKIEQQLDVVAKERAAQLSKLKKIRSEAKNIERRARTHFQKVSEEERWYYTKYTHADYYIRLKAARGALDAASKAASIADSNWSKLEAQLIQSPAGRELNQINEEIAQKRRDVDRLRSKVAQTRDETSRHPVEKVKAKVLSLLPSVLPTAFMILAGIILVPVAIKAILYFAVAPLISRAKPVILMPESTGEIIAELSLTSTPIILAPNDELIVHSDYLQAAGAGPGKRTRILFSWRMPFTSLAAGLYLMVAVRNREQCDTQVVVSPKKDLFDKISDVQIPASSSMVIYPRSLVGILLKQGEYPNITRHWKLGSLHSWITFQFRYLVIHGESRVLIKGCRGVRSDRVIDGKYRMTDQEATLGFSANLAYSGVRCETFFDYLRGKDGLFNDRFGNGNGVHLTEEIPDPRRKRGLFGWSIEGLLDGFLKAFGI